MTVPVLYIIMRTDLDSMNSGKAMAQASHASNAFVKACNKAIETNTNSQPLSDAFEKWQNETAQGFGTVLVLEGQTMSSIEDSIELLYGYGHVAGVVHDPTYPILDGYAVHHIPLNTCGYVFIEDKSLHTAASDILKHYNLHK
jgi:peptidyl-tRNA hydrolase